MAIYHLTAKVISRARGQSVVAAAAYRFGAVLRDERYGITHNYTRKRVILHSEIRAPSTAPHWVQDRSILWNRAESAEIRKDSQLARAIEIGLPIELTAEQSIELLRDYIDQQFVSKGMVADFGISRGDSHNPQAFILLTLREPTESGFGPKARHWNRKSNLLDWRAAWAERANHHLARAGHAVRIDHRALDAQQSELVPARRTGSVRGEAAGDRLPSHARERIAGQQHSAQENGRMILEDPTVVLRALTRQRPTFTHQHIIEFLKSRTHGPAQFDAALLGVMSSPELVALAPADGTARYTSRDMLEAEKSLLKRAASMAHRRGHGVPISGSVPAPWTEAQRRTFQYLLEEGDIKAVAMTGTGAHGVLRASREQWEARGFKVLGAALSPKAASQLAAATGIQSQTLENREKEWRDAPATMGHVIVIDGAEMISLKPLESILAMADRARAKLVLMADARQLQAMGSSSAFYGVLDKTAAPETAGSS